jgi:hypothetical protein
MQVWSASNQWSYYYYYYNLSVKTPWWRLYFFFRNTCPRKKNVATDTFNLDQFYVSGVSWQYSSPSLIFHLFKLYNSFSSALKQLFYDWQEQRIRGVGSHFNLILTGDILLCHYLSKLIYLKISHWQVKIAIYSLYEMWWFGICILCSRINTIQLINIHNYPFCTLDTDNSSLYN